MHILKTSKFINQNVKTRNNNLINFFLCCNQSFFLLLSTSSVSSSSSISTFIFFVKYVGIKDIALSTNIIPISFNPLFEGSKFVTSIPVRMCTMLAGMRPRKVPMAKMWIGMPTIGEPMLTRTLGMSGVKRRKSMNQGRLLRFSTIFLWNLTNFFGNHCKTAYFASVSDSP